MMSIIGMLLFIMICNCCLAVSLALAFPSSPQTQHQEIPLPSSLASEGSLRDMQVSPTMATKPGSTPGFYNPKRRIGRDFVVLSVAHWLATEAKRRAAKEKNSNPENNTGSNTSSSRRPVRLLDATCATGIQGLRTIVESPILARAILSKQIIHDEHGPNTMKDDDDSQHIIRQRLKAIEPPELQLVLNDMDEDAVDITKQNVKSVLREPSISHQEGIDFQHSNMTMMHNNMNINVTQRVAQAILHEETFEVSVLDPFGTVQPFLDAALSRAPQGGLIEVCATDVGVLYGTRPSIAARHYHARLSHKRPPCHRERGVRLLFAAIAQAAGRHDRGVEAVYGISTEHFCLVSMRVLRGAKAADSTARQLKYVKICRKCGAAGINLGERSACGCQPTDGAGTSAEEEGPLWTGPLHDLDTVKQMAEIACLDEAKGFIGTETCTFLEMLREEAAITNMFHRRPGVAAGGRTPKLNEVTEELQRRGFETARTHFCAKSLKTEASVKEFDAAVKSIL